MAEARFDTRQLAGKRWPPLPWHLENDRCAALLPEPDALLRAAGFAEIAAHDAARRSGPA